MSAGEETTTIVLGPRTTVHAVLAAYPGLAGFLPVYDGAFAPVTQARGRVAWTRVVTLGDVALEMNVTWRRLVRDIAAEVRRQTGTAPPTVDEPREVDPLDPRVDELREITLQLERGGSLLQLAARMSSLTAGADAREAESLEAAARDVSAEAVASEELRRSLDTRETDDRLGGLPEGHPAASLRREGAQLEVLAVALRAELERLGGSPSRSRWRAARPLVARLVGGLDGLEVRVRREREAWLAVLGRRGADGVVKLVGDRHQAVLEALRHLRLALARDDAPSVLEHGRVLRERLQELSVCEDQVLVPVAERTLTLREWAEVRQLEDAVGWTLIPPPAPWPGA